MNTTNTQVIEGLKVTITGEELRDLCLKRADHHGKRAKVYAQQEESFSQNEIEGNPNYSTGDPRRVLKEKRQQHEADEAELRFIADHLASAQYVLDSSALSKLGISRRGF